MKRSNPIKRTGITLLEIVLALGLSGMLLYAVGLAMDLHFRALDVQRTRVERAQVARAVLRHISDDVRSAMQQTPVDLEGLKVAAKNQKAALSMMMTNVNGTTGTTPQNGNNQGNNNGPGGNNNGGPNGGPGQQGPGGPPGGGNNPPGVPPGIPGGVPQIPQGFDPSQIPAGALPPGVSAGDIQAAIASGGAGLPGGLAGQIPGQASSGQSSSGQSSGGSGGAGAGGAGGSAGGGRGGAVGSPGGSGGGGRGGQGGQAGGGQNGGRGGAGQPGNGQQGAGRGGNNGGGNSGNGRGGSGNSGSSKSGGGKSGSGGATGGATSGSSSTGGSMQLTGNPASEEEEEGSGPATIVGLFGSATQLQFDISRLPRIDQYASADGQVPSDIQTVIYYLGSLATSSSGITDPSEAVTGLMRVQRERAATSFAETSGDSASNYSGGKLIAAEVAALQFRYFSGEEWLDAWDSDEQGGLPLAVEAEILMAEAGVQGDMSFLSGDGTSSSSNPPQSYRMVIPIPVAKPGANLAEETTEETDSGSSTSSGSSSGSGSSSSSGSR
ncbi:MAG: hypothetical protein U0894_15930 [Pirellulales bacterium]